MGSHADLLARHRAVLPSWLALYYDEPIELVSGSGCHVTDAEGRTYLDFFGGILTTMTGHAVPEVVEAITEQAGRILHSSTLYLIRSQVELAEEIAALAPIPDAKVFFTTSGTEANELALLLATTARRSNQVLALRNSYHGRSFAAMGITGNRGWSASSLTPVNVSYVYGGYRYRSPFQHLHDAAFIEACVDDLRNVIETTTAGDVACMIAEPIQGVGGFTFPPDGLFAAFKEVLDEYGILFISDEVQTGWGRTGQSFWGMGNHGVTPDVMTFAKGLGNGFAVGGVVARGDLMDALPVAGISTFGGNPISMAAANATLDYVLEHDLQANAARQGATLIGGLEAAAGRFPIVRDVRGKGLMFAVELADPRTGEPSPALAAAVMEAARERGLLVGKGGLYGNVIRMAPPMTLTDAEAAEGLGIVVAALEAVNREAAS